MIKLKNHTNKLSSPGEEVTIIKPKSGWRKIDFKELKEYRELFYFLVWRNIKAYYAQTILGFSWAIVQPVAQIVMFGIVFGKVARISTDGIPYVAFTTVAIVPWSYLSRSMTESSLSLVQHQNILGKVYIPRLIFPLTGILAKLIDFSISMLIVFGVLFYFQISLTLNLLFFPLFVLFMVTIPAGFGMWMSTIAIRFRDVRQVLPFIIQLLMYSAPIVYSASGIPEKFRLIYSCNPIVGLMEGYRACLLGTPMTWEYIWPGMIVALAMLVSGAFYFNRMEHVFVDVI